jgi:type VI secretion system FHA domain protein
MMLTLEIVGPQAGKAGGGRKVFDSRGGTIGRQSDSDWVLADPYVSNRHALIRYKDGTFYIEDASTNGVYVNSPTNRLQRGEPYALQSGDWILIEPYEIRVQIADDHHVAAQEVDDPFAIAASPPAYEAQEAAPVAKSSAAEPEILSENHPEDVDPLKLLGLPGDGSVIRSNVSASPRVPDLQRQSVWSDHYRVGNPVTPTSPSASQAPGPIPDSYDPLNPDSRIVHPPVPPTDPQEKARRHPAPSSHVAPHRSAVPTPPVRPISRGGGRPLDVDERFPRGTPGQAAPSRHGAERPRAAAAASDAPVAQGTLADMLAGAGVNEAVTPELARDFGRILRVVVAGVIDVLQARQKLKDEFRLPVTSFKPAENNPLKFSANVDDALHNLLVKRNAAFLGPVDAFEDAFDDLLTHQFAMLAAFRAAFDAMLAEFEPERLQQMFDRQQKGALLPGKLRYWELYCEKIREMTSDPDAFRTLFGEEFGAAYDAHFKRLKTSGGGKS